MTTRDHLLGVTATKHVGDMRHTEALSNACDAGQNLSREDDRFANRLELAETVVARLARVTFVGFAKIPDDMTMPAAHPCDIPFHVAQQAATLGAELAVPLEHHAPLQEVRARG